MKTMVLAALAAFTLSGSAFACGPTGCTSTCSPDGGWCFSSQSSGQQLVEMQGFSEAGATGTDTKTWASDNGMFSLTQRVLDPTAGNSAFTQSGGWGAQALGTDYAGTYGGAGAFTKWSQSQSGSGWVGTWGRPQ